MNIKDHFRLYRLIIILFILFAFFIRIPILKVRFFDPDEFQHLHGARQIYHGELPYRDYFEHHTPFLHFILAGLYPIFGEEIYILFVARALMMIFTGIILLLLYILGKTIYDTDVGLFGALFLSYIIMFLEKTIEVRPDVPAVVFWLASLIFMVKGLRKNSVSYSPRWYALSGISMGIAVMFTQKALFALAGLLIALTWMFFDRRTKISMGRSLKLIFIFIGSLMVPIILTFAYFYIRNGLWEFIYCNFIMNFQWKVKFTPFNYIKQLLRQNPFISAIGILSLLKATFRLYRREEITKGGFITVLCTYMLIFGLFIMPVPYRQYYQLFLPLLAIYCGMFFNEIAKVDFPGLISCVKRRKVSILSCVDTFITLILLSVGLFYALRLSKPAVLNSKNLYLILWLSLLVFAATAFAFNKGKYAAMFISMGIIAYPLNQTLAQLSQRNDAQLASVKHIMEITSPEDTVLGGWSGFGFLRQHAYYYFFLHGEMRAMLTDKEKSDDIIDNLERKRTKAVIYDGAIKAMPQKFQDYIKTHYIPSGHGNIYVRK
jgi:4-amino-4-deoxy-L-arabinose transferase-like glycosyltransferase